MGSKIASIVEKRPYIELFFIFIIFSPFDILVATGQVVNSTLILTELKLKSWASFVSRETGSLPPRDSNLRELLTT